MKCILIFNIDKYKYNKCNFTLYKMTSFLIKVWYNYKNIIYETLSNIFKNVLCKDITKNSIIGTRNYF